MKDGKVVGDRENDTDNYLDYQLENKIYLKDMPEHDTYGNQDIQVDVYSDGLSEAGIKLVLRAGNLYVDTGGKYNVVDENSNIELIDDHYSAMDSSIYENNRFEYDKYLPEGYKIGTPRCTRQSRCLQTGSRQLRSSTDSRNCCS